MESGAVNSLRARGSSRVWAGAVALGAGLGLVAASAFAEEDARKSRFLSLNRADAYVELEGEFQRTFTRAADRRPFQPDRRQENVEWGFEERLGLDLAGYVLDPRFLTFGADFSFALTQDHFEEDVGLGTTTDSDHGYLLEFDARATILPGKMFSGTVYGRRGEDRINRRFLSTLNERRTGFGTSWVWAHPTVPMELTYDYLETDRTGNRGTLDDEHFTDSKLFYGLTWRVNEHHQLKFSYEHGELKQDYQGSPQAFETTRDLFIIDDEVLFGPQQRHSLRTLVHWQEESGDFARDLFEIGPQLRLRHSDTLETLYKYQVNLEDYQGIEVATQRADFQLIHRVYSNLVTTVDLFALYEDVERDVDTTQAGASVDWQYNRANRFGHLYANLALAYDTQDVDGNDGVRLVLDEAHTFRDPLSVTLRNRDVIEAGIVVTDASNRRLYRLGLDYLVIRQGTFTRLVRLRAGRIADRETVLVDYSYHTPGGGNIDTLRVDFGIEQRFTNGLTPYYRVSYRNQEDDFTTGFARRADRTNHHRIGANYEAKRFTLGAEFEVFDDTVDPYDAFHFNGVLRVLALPDHRLDVSGRLSRLFFEGGVDDRNVTLMDMELDHRWRLAEGLSTVERVAYRFEDDSIAGNTHGWDVVAGLEYVVGDLSGELTLEYDRLELPDSEQDDVGVYVRVRRELPNVLGRRE